MSDSIITVDRLGKLFQLNRLQQQHNTLRDALVYSLSAPVRRLRHRQPKNTQPSDELLWALKDISFEVSAGEAIGIIGRNGAGKSTLLKVLSRITEPTEGRAYVQGRVASLLEVGTGFHPELSGRENIYLNGAILGMRRAEIARKFDEIVAFAEIEKFLDTPVKRYSSGMYVRLAFAVAAHLEPEVLVVDEVLAVGDLAFQKKCLGKMEDVAKGGRTVLFVSHNMNAVQRLCTRSILLEHGRLVAQGPTADIVTRYLASSAGAITPASWIDLTQMGRRGTGRARFVSIWYGSDKKSLEFQPYTSGPLEVALIIESDEARAVGTVAVTLYDEYGTKLVNLDTLILGQEMPLVAGRNIVRFRINQLHLNPGIYVLGLWVADPPAEIYDFTESAIRVEVVRLESEGFGLRPTSDGSVVCDFEVLEIAPATE
jgi:lipopolysaccharide transport system ATP-binding protein